MTISQSQYFLLFVFSFALVGFLTPLMRKLAISKEILDRPNSDHKSHTEPIPYLGGIAIILGVILVTYTSLLFSLSPISNFWLITSLIVPALAMGMIGLWDDVKTLPPLTSGRHGLACSTLNTDFIVSGGRETFYQAEKLNLEQVEFLWKICSQKKEI